MDDFLSGIGVVPNVQVEFDAMPSTLSLVESGIGYTILSYSSALSDRSGTHQEVGNRGADHDPIAGGGDIDTALG